MSDLDRILIEGLRRGRSTWPTIAVADDAFVRQVARSLQPPWAVDQLRGLRWADLYLAAACSEGDGAAIAALEAHVAEAVNATLHRMARSAHIRDEVWQLLRHELFVGHSGGCGRIGSYRGRGPLRAYVRVIAMRLCAGLYRREPASKRANDDLLDAMPSASSPELDHLRSTYAGQVQDAMRAAIGALPAAARSLLRYQLVDGLTIDQIAAIYSIHRATAARRLARARAAVLQSTRARLADGLGMREAEVDSIVRLVRSDIDISLTRLLGSRSS